jgi:hypothetical protein
MLWKEIKTWAISHGYKVDRTQVKDQDNCYNYTWATADCSGVASSTFDLAKDIYNHITKDKHTDHQASYNKDYKVSHAIH